MGYSGVHVANIAPAGPGDAVHFVRRELGVKAMIAVGARPGSYEARGPY